MRTRNTLKSTHLPIYSDFTSIFFSTVHYTIKFSTFYAHFAMWRTNLKIKDVYDSMNNFFFKTSPRANCGGFGVGHIHFGVGHIHFGVGHIHFSVGHIHFGVGHIYYSKLFASQNFSPWRRHQAVIKNNLKNSMQLLYHQ